MIKELAIFEREPHEVILTEQQLIIDGFQDQPKFKCFIAEIKKEFGIDYPRYSTWKGAAMHLEDLIVTGKHRERNWLCIIFKVYQILYNQKLKSAMGGSDWNQSAIEFYKNNGAQVLNDWRVALMDKNAIKKFVENESI